MFNSSHSTKTERAAFFLATTNILVREVSKMVGYSRWKEFSNIFKDCYTEHPSPWRKLVKDKGRTTLTQTPIENKTFKISGKGIVGVSLIERGLIGTWDKIYNWKVNSLTIMDNSGNIISVSKQPTLLCNKPLKKVYSTIPEGHLNPLVKLEEGLETLFVSLSAKQGGCRKDVWWEVELEIETASFGYTSIIHGPAWYRHNNHSSRPKQ